MHNLQPPIRNHATQPSLAEVRRDNIQGWLRMWDEKRKDAGSVLLGGSLVNQVILACDELAPVLKKTKTTIQKSETSWKRELLGRIEAGCTGNGYEEEHRVLQHLCKPAVEGLTRELSKPTYDVALIHPHLTAIRQAIERGSLGPLLHREWDRSDADPHLLNTLAGLLVRRGLILHTAVELEKWPARVLVDAYTRAWLGLHGKLLASDETVQKALTSLCFKMLGRMTPAHLNRLKLNARTSLFEIVPQSMLWESHINWLWESHINCMMVEVAHYLLPFLLPSPVAMESAPQDFYNTQASLLPRRAQNALQAFADPE